MLSKCDIKSLFSRVSFYLIKNQRTPLVQWIRICLPMQGTWVWSLVQEYSTCHEATKLVHHNYWSLCSWSLCFTTREAAAIRGPGTITKSSHAAAKTQRNQKNPKTAKCWEESICEFSLLARMEGTVPVPFLSAQCPKFDHGYTVRGSHPTPEWERFTFHRRNPCICNNPIFLQLAKTWNRYWFNFRTPFNSSCGSWDGIKHLDYEVRQIWNLAFVAYCFSTFEYYFSHLHNGVNNTFS